MRYYYNTRLSVALIAILLAPIAAMAQTPVEDRLKAIAQMMGPGAAKNWTPIAATSCRAMGGSAVSLSFVAAITDAAAKMQIETSFANSFLQSTIIKSKAE